jgi:hypothetical protein
MPAPSEPYYPAIGFLVRFGGPFAIVLGLTPLLAAAIAMVLGGPWWIMPVAIIVAGVLFLLVRSYVEMVRIIADTLLPR